MDIDRRISNPAKQVRQLSDFKSDETGMRLMVSDQWTYDRLKK